MLPCFTDVNTRPCLSVAYHTLPIHVATTCPNIMLNTSWVVLGTGWEMHSIVQSGSETLLCWKTVQILPHVSALPGICQPLAKN